MIKFGSSSFINPKDVVLISTTETDREGFPFQATVTLRNGEKYTVNFSDGEYRASQVRNLAVAVEEAESRSDPIQPQVLRWLIQAEVNKLRPYLRRIEKGVQEADNEEA